MLDTNVLSALMRTEPDPVVVSWLDRQSPESIWTTAVTVLEVRFGLEPLPESRWRRHIEAAFAKTLELDLQNRTLPFELAAVEEAARLAAR